MKKWILVVAMLLATITFVSCGNYDVIDTKYSFDKAHIRINDVWIDVEIATWRDYDGEQLQIKLKNGSVLLISSFNCILYSGELPNVV